MSNKEKVYSIEELKNIFIAARALLVKMKRVEASKEFKGMETMAFVHGYKYTGESWGVERDALDAALEGK